MNDSPKEMAYLDRAELWEGLIEFCEELERNEIEAEVGWQASGTTRSGARNLPGSGAPSLKRPKTSRKPKTENRKRLLKSMSRAVARDLGLI